MYLGKSSITLLRTYLDGFDLAYAINSLQFNWRKFRSNKETQNDDNFQNWVAEKILGRKETPMGWCSLILEKTEKNEEQAFDLFFALLEEFKLEKEDLRNE
jgi:hypothetical protein